MRFVGDSVELEAEGAVGERSKVGAEQGTYFERTETEIKCGGGDGADAVGFEGAVGTLNKMNEMETWLILTVSF
jgi:hypothetical protein